MTELKPRARTAKEAMQEGKDAWLAGCTFQDNPYEALEDERWIGWAWGMRQMKATMKRVENHYAGKW